MRPRLFKLFLAAATLFASVVPTEFLAQSFQPGDPSEGGFGGRRRFGGGGRFGGGAGGGRFGGGFGGGRFGGNRFGGGRFGANTPERATSAPLELRGIAGRGENVMVSIVNIETGESDWYGLRDSKKNLRKRDPIYVESVNIKARSAIVRYNGASLKLDFITTTGEPMSIRAQAMPVSADSAVSGDGAVNPHALATQMLAFRGGAATPDQMRAFGEQMQSLTPEQRQQVFSEFRQMNEAAGGGPPFGPPPPSAMGGGGGDAGGDDGGSAAPAQTTLQRREPAANDTGARQINRQGRSRSSSGTGSSRTR